MKKILIILLITTSFFGFSQQTLLIDYAADDTGEKDPENRYGELYLSSYTESKEGSVYNGVLLKEKKGYSSSAWPYIEIPLDSISSFNLFLKNGIEKFYEWEKIRKENNIEDVERTIDTFEVKMTGRDGSKFLFGNETLELIYDVEANISKMRISARIAEGNYSDFFYVVLINSNDEWREKAFFRFINHMTYEKIKEEIDNLNKKADLFN
jgi:hypothetical protein